MSAEIRKKLRSAMRKAASQDFGVAGVELRRAVYDAFVFKHGLKAVGEWELYERKPVGYWTLDRCKEDALKYATRTAWWAGSGTAAEVASKNGWLDQCCAHMALIQLPNGYWTLARCKAEALKYKKRTQWARSSPVSYNAAHRKGWREECCAHMPKINIGNLKEAA